MSGAGKPPVRDAYVDGAAKLIVIECGPLSFHGAKTKADLARMERAMRDDLDGVVRAFLSVGPRSQFVRTRLVSAEETRP